MMIIMSYSIVYMTVSLAAGRMADNVNPHKLCTIGMAGVAGIALLFSLLLKQNGLWPVFVFFVIFGLSFALFFSPNNKVVIGAAPPGKQGVVSGVFRMVLNLSMACGICLFESVFSAAGHLPDQISPALVALFRGPLISGFQSAYFLGGLLGLLAVVFCVLSEPRRRA